MIDTTTFAFPKPGHASGRVVLTGKKYSAHKRKTWKRQSELCARGPHAIPDPKEAALHHPHGRGMGGGKRDDRDTEIVCTDCHATAPIERRESWT